MIVIVDASTFIGLSMVNKLSLLSSLFKEVVLPNAVYEEISGGKGVKEIRSFKNIKVVGVNDKATVELMLESYGRGEAELLVLAKELNANLLLIDELKARKAARRAGFKVMGILGLLLSAKEKGFIKTIKPLIQRLQKKDFRLSRRVIEEVLNQAGETP